MTNGPDDISFNVERFTALEEASAHFGIVLRSLYDTYAEDITVDPTGKQELILVNRTFGNKNAQPGRTLAALSRPTNEILPALSVTTKAPDGVTTRRHYSFEDMVYVRTESRYKRDAISGMEVPEPIDPDDIESHETTAHELEDTLKFLGTLLPARLVEAEVDRRYEQSHGFRSFIRHAILGKKPEA